MDTHGSKGLILVLVGVFGWPLGSKIGDLNFRCVILRFYGDFYSYLNTDVLFEILRADINAGIVHIEQQFPSAIALLAIDERDAAC